MASKLKRLLLALLVPVTAIGLLAAKSGSTIAQTPNNLTDKAKLEVSQRTGIPIGRLSVVNRATLVDTEITQFKVIDFQGKIYGVYLNAAGNVVSKEAVNQVIQAFNNKGFVGKLEADLAKLLPQVSNCPIRVSFSLNEQMRTPFLKPLVNELQAKGQKVIYQSSGASVVIAAVTPSVIHEMAHRPDVVRIYLDRSIPILTAEPPQQRNITSRPPQLMAVYPAPGSTHTCLQSVGASLNFQLGGASEYTSLQMFVDGVDVTSQARTGGTRDIPPSSWTISYTPIFSKAGTHRAEVRFRTLDGATQSYSWSFTIKSP